MMYMIEIKNPELKNYKWIVNMTKTLYKTEKEAIQAAKDIDKKMLAKYIGLEGDFLDKFTEKFWDENFEVKEVNPTIVPAKKSLREEVLSNSGIITETWAEDIRKSHDAKWNFNALVRSVNILLAQAQYEVSGSKWRKDFEKDVPEYIDSVRDGLNKFREELQPGQLKSAENVLKQLKSYIKQ